MPRPGPCHAHLCAGPFRIFDARPSTPGMTTSAGLPRVHWFHGISPERERRERELLSAGCPLPARARCSWARAFPRINTSLLVVEGANGLLGALAVERHASRALPRHHIMRVFRAGACLPVGVAG